MNLTRTFTHPNFEFGNNCERSCDVRYTFDGATFRVLHTSPALNFGRYDDPITQHFDDGEMSDADFAAYVELWAEEIAGSYDADLIRAAIDKLAPVADLAPDELRYLRDCLADNAGLQVAA